MSKTELDFSLILSRAINMITVTGNSRLRTSFSNHSLIVRLSLSSEDIRNCKERTTFVKECKKNIECKKKGILNLEYKRGFLFEKSKEQGQV